MPASASLIASNIKFSQLELELISLLPESRADRISTLELVNRYYGDDPPINARVIIIDRLRGIRLKAKAANLPWRLKRTARAGPNPQFFWIEKVEGSSA